MNTASNCSHFQSLILFVIQVLIKVPNGHIVDKNRCVLHKKFSQHSETLLSSCLMRFNVDNWHTSFASYREVFTEIQSIFLKKSKGPSEKK